jgi:hypothetical protein
MFFDKKKFSSRRRRIVLEFVVKVTSSGCMRWIVAFHLLLVLVSQEIESLMKQPIYPSIIESNIILST